MKNKTKKIVVSIFLTILIAILGVFLYFFIYSNMYKLECSRVDEILTGSYCFEFNMFKKITNIERRMYLELPTEEMAMDRYKEEKKAGENVKLEGKKIIFFTKDLDYDFSNSLKETKETCTNLGYYCRMVRK